MQLSKIHSIGNYLKRPVSIAPLITFRILFGALMLWGGIRFVANGWVERLFLEPRFFFKYYGFEWVQVLDETGMYMLMAIIITSAALIMLGLFYRLAIITFFLSFSYLELIDATNYLNHYYLVCLLAFLLIFLPANRAFSLDSWRKPSSRLSQIPAWMIYVLMGQVGLVYFFAGLAKLNPDWLWHAMPLAVWLPEHQDIPLLGYFFQMEWTAYLFSWAGAFYDLTIAFFLLNRKTRPFAYGAVLLFHGLTYLLFNIGLFPFIMICNTLIFFSGDFHEHLLGWIGYRKEGGVWQQRLIPARQLLQSLLVVFFIIQLLLPLRYLAYPGNLLWTEEGYRFSWRVMLVEKAGHTIFHVKDAENGRQTEIVNGQYLTHFQEKQMNIQPDFILQFAQFLKEEYQSKHGIETPVVRVDAYVALNGRTSQRFIDPTTNLAEIQNGLRPKSWILPFNLN